MKSSRALSAAAVSVVAFLSLATSAGAANVTVGPSLTGIWESEECEIEACTFINDEPSGVGTNLRSPVDGAIVRANVVGGSTVGTYRVGTALKFAKAGFTIFKWGAPVASSPMKGVQSFSTVVPIEKGMWISLTMSETASLGFREGDGQLVGWEYEPFESENTEEGEIFPEELAGFNVEIQPAPTVSSLGTTSGPTGGGTAVTINGTDLENTTGVNFGSTPATSFTVNSGGQLTAVAPANASAASVSVAVTTIAGKATSPQNYTYVAPPATTVPPPPPVRRCVVPKLTGKRLVVVRIALFNARCKLGSVKKLDGATAKSGRVSKQTRKPGTTLAVGSKVAVTLKPVKPATKKGGKK